MALEQLKSNYPSEVIRFPASAEADHSRGLCTVRRVLKDSLISSISGQVGKCNCNHSEFLWLELTGKQFILLSGFTYSVGKWEGEGRLHKKEATVGWARSPLAPHPRQLNVMPSIKGVNHSWSTLPGSAATALFIIGLPYRDPLCQLERRKFK